MSTRASILVKDNDMEQWFYRHSDGYPEGALPTLTTFMEWVRDEKIRNNVGQAAGWLVMIGATEYSKKYDPSVGRWVSKPTTVEPQGGAMGWKVGAYEPLDEPTSDSEYIYRLHLVNLTIDIEDIFAGSSVRINI